MMRSKDIVIYETDTGIRSPFSKWEPFHFSSRSETSKTLHCFFILSEHVCLTLSFSSRAGSPTDIAASWTVFVVSAVAIRFEIGRRPEL